MIFVISPVLSYGVGYWKINCLVDECSHEISICIICLLDVSSFMEPHCVDVIYYVFFSCAILPALDVLDETGLYSAFQNKGICHSSSYVVNDSLCGLSLFSEMLYQVASWCFIFSVLEVSSFIVIVALSFTFNAGFVAMTGHVCYVEGYLLCF